MDEQLTAKIKEVKAKIKSNSKDAHFADTLIDELVGLQKQADIEPVELIVPCAEVEHVRQIDDVTSLIKTIRGYLYKHGVLTYIWVPFGLNTLYSTMSDFDELLGKEERTEDDEVQISAVNRMLQWHTVAFLDAESLLDSAKASVEILNNAVLRFQSNTKAQLTADDIEMDTLAATAGAALTEIADLPTPATDAIED